MDFFSLMIIYGLTEYLKSCDAHVTILYQDCLWLFIFHILIFHVISHTCVDIHIFFAVIHIFFIVLLYLSAAHIFYIHFLGLVTLTKSPRLTIEPLESVENPLCLWGLCGRKESQNPAAPSGAALHLFAHYRSTKVQNDFLNTIHFMCYFMCFMSYYVIDFTLAVVQQAR